MLNRMKMLVRSVLLLNHVESSMNLITIGKEDLKIDFWDEWDGAAAAGHSAGSVLILSLMKESRRLNLVELETLISLVMKKTISSLVMMVIIKSMVVPVMMLYWQDTGMMLSRAVAVMMFLMVRRE